MARFAPHIVLLAAICVNCTSCAIPGADSLTQWKRDHARESGVSPDRMMEVAALLEEQGRADGAATVYMEVARRYPQRDDALQRLEQLASRGENPKYEAEQHQQLAISGRHRPGAGSPTFEKTSGSVSANRPAPGVFLDSEDRRTVASQTPQSNPSTWIGQQNRGIGQSLVPPISHAGHLRASSEDEEIVYLAAETATETRLKQAPENDSPRMPESEPEFEMTPIESVSTGATAFPGVRQPQAPSRSSVREKRAPLDGVIQAAAAFVNRMGRRVPMTSGKHRLDASMQSAPPTSDITNVALTFEPPGAKRFPPPEEPLPAEDQPADVGTSTTQEPPFVMELLDSRRHETTPQDAIQIGGEFEDPEPAVIHSGREAAMAELKAYLRPRKWEVAPDWNGDRAAAGEKTREAVFDSTSETPLVRGKKVKGRPESTMEENETPHATLSRALGLDAASDPFSHNHYNCDSKR